MMKTLLALLLLPSLALAQSYPSPTYQNLTVHGNATVGGTLGVTGATTLGNSLSVGVPGGGYLTTLNGPYNDATGALFIYHPFSASGTIHPTFLSQSGASGTTTGTGFINSFAVGSDTLSTTGDAYGLYVGHNAGGTGMTGGRAALAANLYFSGGTSNTTPKFYVGAAFSNTVSGSDNGQPSSVYGSSTSIWLTSAATGYGGALSHEFDFGLDTPVTYAEGVKIVQVNNSSQVHSYHGTNTDTGLAFVNQGGNGLGTTAAGWNTVLSFGSGTGWWPGRADGTSTLIGTLPSGISGGPAYAAAYGADFRAVSFSGCAYASLGFCVDGAGKTTVAGLVTNGDLYDNSIPAVVVPTTGNTVTIAAGAQRTLIDPAATLAALTVTLPACAVPSNGLVKKFSFTQIIMALTVNAATGTVKAGPSAAAVGSAFGFACVGAAGVWYPTL